MLEIGCQDCGRIECRCETPGVHTPDSMLHEIDWSCCWKFNEKENCE